MALKLLLGMDKQIGSFPKGSGKSPASSPFLISCPLGPWRVSMCQGTLLSPTVSPWVPALEGKRGLSVLPRAPCSHNGRCVPFSSLSLKSVPLEDSEVCLICKIMYALSNYSVCLALAGALFSASLLLKVRRHPLLPSSIPRFPT